MRARRWVRGVVAALAVAAAGLAPVVAAPETADAGHGSWHHNHHIQDPNPSQYRAYAHTYSTQSNDAVYARMLVWRNGTLVVARTADCGPINEGCQYATTSWGYWSQGGSHEADSHHCGKDGTHQIGGFAQPFHPCARVYGLSVHLHSTDWND